MNQLLAGSNVIGCGLFIMPGIARPVRPTSGGSGLASPNSDAANVQKLSFPTEVVLIEPDGSAIAW